MLVVSDDEGWLSPPVSVALGFGRRWRGLRPLANGRGLVLSGRSVHTVGMREALWLVGLNGDGLVTHVRYVIPKRAVVLAGARFILELPPTWPPPPVGSSLAIQPAISYQVGQKRLRTSRPILESFETTKSIEPPL